MLLEVATLIEDVAGTETQLHRMVVGSESDTVTLTSTGDKPMSAKLTAKSAGRVMAGGVLQVAVTVVD